MPSDLWLMVGAIVEAILENPWVFAVQALISICATTRVWTQIRAVYRKKNAVSGTQTIPRIPHWIPFLANTPSFSLHQQSWLLKQSQNYESGAFALSLLRRNYIVITAPELLSRLSDSSMPINSRLYEDQQSRYFFANRQVNSTTRARIHSATQSNKDSAHRKKIIQQLETHAYNFISPSKSWVDQAQWERGADVKVLGTSPTLSVSASLTRLVRDFTAHVIISTILGVSFIEANPGFVNDFFAFGGKHAMFMTGLPYWIAPGLGPPALAREKCLLALDGLVTTLVVEVTGESGKFLGTGLLIDTDEVQPAIRELVKQAIYQSGGHKTSTRTISCEILEIIFEKTFFSVNMVLWMLIYLFMDGNEHKATLVNILREAKSIVEVVKPPPSGLPFEDPPRLKFKNAGENDRNLKNKCPVLEAALCEVCRLETEFERYFVVEQDVVLGTGASKNLKARTSSQMQGISSESFQLLRGDHVYAAYGAATKDPKRCERPRRFVPGRYMRSNGSQNDKKTGKASGSSQYESEADIICILSALLAFFEISRIDGAGLDHPGTRIVAGIGQPKKDMKVQISRRSI